MATTATERLLIMEPNWLLFAIMIGVFLSLFLAIAGIRSMINVTYRNRK